MPANAIDMCFSWVKDHAPKGKIPIYWARGKDNMADYFTKHHSSCYLLNLHGLPELGGCCSKGVMIYLICQHNIILLQHQLVLMNCG
jgi:hypothetical protein